jgi:sugar phosphate permease
MTARWIPLEERSSFIARSFFGSTFGLVFTFPMCGYLVVHSGWESAFYVIGCLTIVWFGFWWLLVFDNPESHPRISKSEKDLIEASLAGNVDLQKSLPVPWRKILTSIPFLGLMATDMSNSWGIIGLGTSGPTYLKYMLGVDIKTNGLVSGLPMLSRYLGGVFHSLIADWLQKRHLISVVWTRRIFNSISQFAPAIAMLVSSIFL